MVRTVGLYGSAQAPPRGCRSRSPREWGAHCKHRSTPSHQLKQRNMRRRSLKPNARSAHGHEDAQPIQGASAPQCIA
eukprot:1270284-Alexandrium_andersonii.AAC.1